MQLGHPAQGCSGAQSAGLSGGSDQQSMTGSTGTKTASGIWAASPHTAGQQQSCHTALSLLPKAPGKPQTA